MQDIRRRSKVAETRCKVCASEHRAEIEQAAARGTPLREVAETILVKYAENISHVSISTHLNKHKTLAEETAITAVESLEKRVRNLELNAFVYGPGGDDRGWSTYSIAGAQPHSLSRMEVLVDAIPNNKGLKAEFRALQDRIIAKRQKADGLPLNDEEFIKQRAEKAKAEEEAIVYAREATKKRMMQAAEDEVLRIKTDHENLLKALEKSAKKQERQNRLQALRDAELEERAGIDSEGNSIR
jgi:TusA-related sulfurtransferase